MPPIPDRLAAALADRYRIERELGAGGMATVYLAADLKHDRKVAIKVLKPELAAVLGAERFVQEIKTTAALSHPHILPLLDSGEAGGLLYYVMPFIEGETIRDRLNRETQLGIDEAVKIATEVADALDYAHRHGVIHRDIKPENILLHDGRPMVMDFGIALAVSAAAGGRMTETGLSLGTPHYMSPEQATADKQITARSDVYSLASVLYEMVTGEPPHTGTSAQAIIMKIIADVPRPATELRKSVPPNIAAALAKALEKVPADRFDSAKAFAEALENPFFAAAETGGRSAMPGRRVPTRTVSVLAGVALVASVLAVWGWARHPEAEPAGRSRFYYTTDSTHMLSALCCGPLQAISRDGRRFAYVGSVLGRAEIFVRELDELEAHPLPGTRAGTSLFFSPDGQWLGFAGQDGSIYKIAVAPAGAPVRVAKTGRQVTGATWTDQNIIVYATDLVGSEQASLWSVSADGGEPTLLADRDSASGRAGYGTPWAVPGSDAILFTTWGTTARTDDAQIHMLHLASPERSVAVTRGMQPQMTGSGHLLVALGGGSLAAQAFDPRTGKTSGAVEYLADGVFVSRAGGWSDYAVSWNGTLLYRLGGIRPQMALVQADGSARGLGMDLDGVSHYDSPRFSPDGRRLALVASMTGGHRIMVMDLDRGSLLRVTLDGNSEHFDWTDDGDSLIVARDYRELAIYPANRGGEGRVILPTVDSVGVARAIGRVSVSGPWVAFAYEGAGSQLLRTTGLPSDILVARRGSDVTVQPYAATQFRESSPAIAPNGRWMAFVSDETGRDEVYVSAFPTPAGRQSVSLDGGGEPVWASDGRTLYFRSQSGGVIAARVRADGASFVVDRLDALPIGGYELSPDGADYDVAPGAASFAMIESRTSGSSLVIVLNALTGTGKSPE